MILLNAWFLGEQAHALPTECPVVVTGAEVADYRADVVVPQILAAASALADVRSTYGDASCPSEEGAACTGPSGVTFGGTLAETTVGGDSWDDAGCYATHGGTRLVAGGFVASPLAAAAEVTADGSLVIEEDEYHCRYYQRLDRWTGTLGVVGSWGGLADTSVSGTASVAYESPSWAGGIRSGYEWDGSVGTCAWTSSAVVEEFGESWYTGDVVVDGVRVEWGLVYAYGCQLLFSLTTIDGVPVGDAMWAMPADWPPATEWVDADSDGWSAFADCDDTDPAVERSSDCDGDGLYGGCNGEDCDDRNADVDEHRDDDGDGWGDHDCDDRDATIHPGAAEVCGDGIDHNCDGHDGGDCDGDDSPAVYDCDDTDPAFFPGAPEVCGDGIDHDCDGHDGGDCDGDGSPERSDCNDADPTISPLAVDPPCDGIDQDCNGVDGQIDCDEDGFIHTDCDDHDPTVNQDATDVCGDGVDQDCDGEDPECPGGPPGPTCGCSTPDGAPWLLLPGLVTLLTRRRRPSSR